MNILITGARGFVGRNLVENLKNIRDGKNRTVDIKIDEIYEYDIETPESLLDTYCESADFVFNLAGVNRPKDNSEFMAGNFGFASRLLDTLKKYENKCPVMLSSSIQASLEGRYAASDYGKSKLAGENLFFDYANETGAPVYVYRFPNLFGKWCRPNYNSAVATFCHNIANGLEITVNDPAVRLELVYIDDLIDEMLRALSGKPTRCEDEKFCRVPVSHSVTLGEIVSLLRKFDETDKNFEIPEMPAESFEKKLFATFLSYLPRERAVYGLKMNVDARGSFTELVKSEKCGQVSVNISEPGITKGQHWHNTKWELFIVVSGHGLIQQRKIGRDEVLNFEVSGDKIEAVRMLPGYTHNIINLSETERLVTVMYANESFDASKPDTFFEVVE